jgi:hypothetical protein
MGGIVDSVFGGGGGGGSSAPAVPDYTSLANQTAANNLKAAQTAAAANRVNQFTPYGSLQYSEAGTDSQGNPIYNATQTPTEPLGSAINSNIGQIANQYGTQFNGGNLPSYGINPNQTYSDAIMQRLQPQQQMQQKQFDAQMANQGIPVGSEAYQNAARIFQQGQNDQRTSAITGGIGVGLQANQQQYNQNLANYQLPLTVGSQLKALGTPNYINPAQQQTTAGADVLSAGIGGYNANMGQYNARQAANQNFNSGLFGLGQAGLMSPTGTFNGIGSSIGNGLSSVGDFIGGLF